MRRKILPFVLLLSAMCLCSSCLNGDDDEVTYYDDTAISSFVLGTLNQYVHTTKTYPNSDGVYEDSVYKKTVTGSQYKFYIDQEKAEIYNPDSLPLGVDASKVICTISAKNNGRVVIKNISSDTLVYYSSTDSIDFSVPREVRVYNSNGTGYRAYTIRVNVHQEDGEQFNWEQVGEVPVSVAALLDERAQVLAAKTWLQGPFDDDATLLPTEDISLVAQPLKTNAGNRYVLVGNRSVVDYADDAYAMIWSRVVESDAQAETQPWLFTTPLVSDDYLLPRLKGLQVVSYDGGLLAVGAQGVGACTAEPFSCFYESKDGGLTWHENSTYQLPSTFDTTTQSFALVADGAYLWLVCTDTQQVWRGCLNRMRWTSEQKVFR